MEEHLAYHFVKIYQVAVIDAEPSKQHCESVTDRSEGETLTRLVPRASSGGAGPLVCRKWKTYYRYLLICKWHCFRCIVRVSDLVVCQAQSDIIFSWHLPSRLGLSLADLAAISFVKHRNFIMCGTIIHYKETKAIKNAKVLLILYQMSDSVVLKLVHAG